jgi:hypothetical protein
VLGGDSNLGLTTLDVNVLWNVAPGFTLDDHSLVPYTEAGIGYVWSDLNLPLYGVTGTTPRWCSLTATDIPPMWA